ncbi:MAG: HNH endonuclease, partial [Lachnospiraceae bacterium]|nr:HNH endonuclease [Lachnospiraceae bacterium]
LYEILEGNLEHMPKSCAKTLTLMNNVSIIPTNLEFDKNQFDTNNSLRSPRYKINLLDHIGIKHCPLCHCEIPELIQGAHIWPVSQIKKSHLSYDEQLAHAISGENGIWLCENHHKLFDENMITFDNSGKIIIHTSDITEKNFIKKITEETTLPDYYFSDGFFKYLSIRNAAI